ncbi:MAG TPA: hypothetical protein VHR64_11760 [Thermomicrobiales bacterium]|nr:hypothetical protein [Thermomicrobiales bacterium]
MPAGRRHRFLLLIHALTVIALLLGSSALALPQVAAQDSTPAAAEAPTQPPPGESADPTQTPTPEPTIAIPEATATQSAPVDTATPEPSAAAPTATSTPAAAPTATASPTREPSAIGPAATSGTLTIKAVDAAGNPVTFTCFDVYQDAGGGTLGSRVKTDYCDNLSSGVVKVPLTAGSYVLVEIRRAPEFGTALNKPFTFSGDRSITVTHQLLTKIVITSTDSVTGQPVAGACYTLEPQTPIILPPQYLSCDGFDDLNDGVTTINGVDRGTFTLIEFSPPLGYFQVANRDITISTLSSPRSVTIAHEKGATLRISKRTESDQPLAGACFTLLANNNGVPGSQIGENLCDATYGANDGTIEGFGFPTGDYFLHEQTTPVGYLPIADQPISLTAGQTTELTVVDPLGGRVDVHAVDDRGNPIPDICPTVFRDAGGGVRGEQLQLPACDLGTNGNDGVTTLIGLPPGNFLLVQPNPAWRILTGEYAPGPDVAFAIAAGQTRSVQIVSPVGGKLVVTVVDQAHPETKLLGACFTVYTDAGSGTRGTAIGGLCDGLAPYDVKDGVVPLSGLAAGSYVLAQTQAPAPFNLAADVTVTVALRDVKNITVALKPYGKVRIFKQTPEGAALPGACFIAIYGPGSAIPGNWASGTICDNADGANDGTIQISLADGKFELQEQTAPAGYVRAPNTDIEITDGGVTDVTIVDPVPSTLILSFVNVWHEPVTGLCVDSTGRNETFGGLPGGGGCDPDDGAKDGRITLTGLTWGAWSSRVGNPGSYTVPEISGQLAPGESKTVEVVLTEAQPKITVGPRIDGLSQTSVTISWETDQKMISAVTIETSGAATITLPETAGAPTRTHRITISGLTANTLYTVRAVPTSPNGNVTSSALSVRTPSAELNSQVIASVVKSDASPLPGACLSVYRDAGGGQVGTFVRSSCDWADADGNNGTITISGLSAGSFVLIQFYAPRYYKVAKPVLFTLTSGQSRQLTVTNTRGGVTLKVFAREYNGPTLLNTCYSIYRNPGDGTIGAYVTDLCDNFDAVDGFTTFSGIGPGDYYLWQYKTPSGYVADPIKKFTVLSGQTNRYITYSSRKTTDTDNVVLKTIDSTGALKPGACFWLYRADNGGEPTDYVGDACDADDGRNDGVTYFTRVQANYSYAALEYVAPSGYVAGKMTYFTKAIDTLYSKRITQVAGGVPVKVTTLKGSTSTKLPGACYGVYRLIRTTYVAVSVACDSWDGSVDGVTIIRGVPAGTYRLYQNGTPAGYRAPTYITVTVGTTTKSVTVRTYP